MQVFPLVGLPSATLDKPKYKKCFDCVYLSSRSAQLLDAEYFASLMRPNDNGFGGVVAVETGKFLTPLTKESKAELTKKETDLAAKLSLKRVDGKYIILNDVCFYNDRSCIVSSSLSSKERRE